MSLTHQEQRELSRLAPRLRLGLVRGLRLHPFTERQRGRDAAMGYARQGRVADYAPVVSFVRGEPVYRAKEVSARFEIVITLCLTGEAHFDQRIAQFAHYWAYMATRCLGGSATLLREPAGRFVYEPPANDALTVESTLSKLQRGPVSRAPSNLIAVRHFAGCIGAFYEGSHLVIIGPYWEEAEVEAYASGQP